MRDINQWTGVGRLGKKPELKETVNKVPVVDFSIANSRDYKDRDGNEVKRTNWINCRAYKGLAETIANGNQEENARRILDCIDSVETKSKVKYLVNATRSTIKWHRGLGGLSKNEYFRMIYILKNILLEDIEFIIEKLKMKELITCESCVALYNLGLMYYTTIEDNTMYAFSSLAYRFYEEVIKYDDENLPKILTPKEFPEEFQLPSNVVYFSEID